MTKASISDGVVTRTALAFLCCVMSLAATASGQKDGKRAPAVTGADAGEPGGKDAVGSERCETSDGRTLTSSATEDAVSRDNCAAERPDVVMIAIDDLRPMLGCYGDPHVRTPNIDRLARRGVVFERAYCQYAVCGPSRLSLMTGLRPDAIGVFSNLRRDVAGFRKRRPDVVSMAMWLGRHGYYTQSFGKIDHDGWDVVTDWSVPPSPGRPREMWEIVDPDTPAKPTIIAERVACPVMQSPDVADEHFFAGRMTQQALATMRDRRSDRPVFLAVGFRRPHLPFVAPQRYFDMYQPDASWLAENPDPPEGSPVMAWFNSDGYVKMAGQAGLAMPSQPNRHQAVDWNGYEMRSYLGIPNHGAIEGPLQLKILQAYAACVSYVDAQIGRLLDELEASKRLENTAVILWSDHGWHLGEQSAWGKKTNFEIATRVPLIIVAPGVKPGRTQTIAELVDLYPTICELTGLQSPPHIEGQSLVESLRNPGKARDQVALSQQTRFAGRYMGRALRTDRFRFVVWTETESGRIVNRELYDHQSDPHEMINVASRPAYSARLTQLERMHKEAFQRSRD